LRSRFQDSERDRSNLFAGNRGPGFRAILRDVRILETAWRMKQSDSSCSLQPLDRLMPWRRLTHGGRRSTKDFLKWCYFAQIRIDALFESRSPRPGLRKQVVLDSSCWLRFPLPALPVSGPTSDAARKPRLADRCSSIVCIQEDPNRLPAPQGKSAQPKLD